MSLTELYPEGKTVTAGGESINVKKFMARQFGQAARLGKPVLVALFGSGLFKLNGESVAISDSWPLLILDVLADGTDAVIELCAFAIGKPVEWFDNVDGAELIEIARTVFEVNQDFISARILPSLGVVATPVHGTGMTVLTPSLPQDTDAPTSTVTP